jgi:DNA topoisomerase 2-associated protein PAT1
MSFFDLPHTDPDRASQDVAVYTWGEESYDGLGDALQERGDELNDETFGSVDQVGRRLPLPFSPHTPLIQCPLRERL